jgi:hypothetical protein
VNDSRRHRITTASALLGKDRTPWGTIRPALRIRAEQLHPAFADRRSPRHPVCASADVRAWLGPRRAGRRTLIH